MDTATAREKCKEPMSPRADNKGPDNQNSPVRGGKWYRLDTTITPWVNKKVKATTTIGLWDRGGALAPERSQK